MIETKQVLAEVFQAYQARSPDELAALLRRRYRRELGSGWCKACMPQHKSCSAPARGRMRGVLTEPAEPAEQAACPLRRSPSAAFVDPTVHARSRWEAALAFFYPLQHLFSAVHISGISEPQLELVHPPRGPALLQVRRLAGRGPGRCRARAWVWAWGVSHGGVRCTAHALPCSSCPAGAAPAVAPGRGALAPVLHLLSQQPHQPAGGCGDSRSPSTGLRPSPPPCPVCLPVCLSSVGLFNPPPPPPLPRSFLRRRAAKPLPSCCLIRAQRWCCGTKTAGACGRQRSRGGSRSNVRAGAAACCLLRPRMRGCCSARRAALPGLLRCAACIGLPHCALAPACRQHHPPVRLPMAWRRLNCLCVTAVHRLLGWGRELREAEARSRQHLAL